MTRAEALVRLAQWFRTAGLEDPIREARQTLLHACRLSPAALISAPELPLGEAVAQLGDFAERRASGEPLSKIIGRREFWGLSLAISSEVLDPRPETETLVEAALAHLGGRRSEPLNILDLGVGSGALLLALLSEFPHGYGVGVDLSAAAAAIARCNAKACHLDARADIRIGRWTEGLAEQFDLIVSNPPYIPSAAIASLPREVRDFDPRLALDGGVDGLDAYRAIIPASASMLAPNGWLVVEVGAGQANEVLALATKAGFVRVESRPDLAGLERAVAAQRPDGEVDHGTRHAEQRGAGAIR